MKTEAYDALRDHLTYGVDSVVIELEPDEDGFPREVVVERDVDGSFGYAGDFKDRYCGDGIVQAQVIAEPSLSRGGLVETIRFEDPELAEAWEYFNDRTYYGAAHFVRWLTIFHPEYKWRTYTATGYSQSDWVQMLVVGMYGDEMRTGALMEFAEEVEKDLYRREWYSVTCYDRNNPDGGSTSLIFAEDWDEVIEHLKWEDLAGENVIGHRDHDVDHSLMGRGAWIEPDELQGELAEAFEEGEVNLYRAGSQVWIPAHNIPSQVCRDCGLMPLDWDKYETRCR